MAQSDTKLIKDSQVVVRFTENIKARIISEATGDGLSPAAWVRLAAMQELKRRESNAK